MANRLTTCFSVAALVGCVALAGCQGQARVTSPAVADSSEANRIGSPTSDNLTKSPVQAPNQRRQILVKFKPGVQAAEINQLRAQFGTRNVGRIEGIDVWIEEVVNGQSVADTIRAMMASGNVEYAEENQEVSIRTSRF